MDIIIKKSIFIVNIFVNQTYDWYFRYDGKNIRFGTDDKSVYDFEYIEYIKYYIWGIKFYNRWWF